MGKIMGKLSAVPGEYKRRSNPAVDERRMTRHGPSCRANFEIRELLGMFSGQRTCMPIAWAGWRERVLAKATNSLSALRLARVGELVNQESINFVEIGDLADTWRAPW
jgi:hypothetical protein